VARNPLADALGVDLADVTAVIDALRAREETVATAESLTGGLVAALLTSVAGASDVVRGGLVVYATSLKTELAGVDAALLAEHGAVHPAVAEQLAGGARERCGASWGLGLTGVAGPDPQDGVEPGVVHVALAGPADVVTTVGFDGNRHQVRAAAVRAALSLLSAQVIEPDTSEE
jgi:nicotinamide-nucleotide amidase